MHVLPEEVTLAGLTKRKLTHPLLEFHDVSGLAGLAFMQPRNSSKKHWLRFASNEFLFVQSHLIAGC